MLGSNRENNLKNNIAYDFISDFDLSEQIHETREIKFGTKEAEKHLISGWSEDEKAKDESTFTWAIGSQSELEVYIFNIEDKLFKLVCWPFNYPESPEQKIKMYLNNYYLCELRLFKGKKDYDISIPKKYIKKGRNLISFEYAYNTTVKDVLNCKDVRPLAVAFTYLYIATVHKNKGSKLMSFFSEKNSECKDKSENSHVISIDDVFIDNQSKKVIIQPPKTLLNYYLKIPEKSKLVFGIISKYYNKEVKYQVFVTSDNEERKELFSKVFNKDNKEKEDIFLREKVDLLEYANKTVKLTFLLESENLLGRINGMWVEPTLLKETNVKNKFTANVVLNNYFKNRPNIILYLVDDLRADHLGCYDYKRNTSPNIDAFAKDSILFEKTFAQATWTKPACASLFTGYYPSVHQVIGEEDYLDESIETLSSILKEHGYKTIGFTSNVWVSDIYGYDKGFDKFEIVHPGQPGNKTSSEEINEKLFEWFRNRGSEPFFLYAHACDPHEPFVPPEEFNKFKADYNGPVDGSVEGIRALLENIYTISDEVIEHLKGLYDGEILHNDYNFGFFIKFLKEINLYDNSIIIFTSDHGEEFYEHGTFSHSGRCYNEHIHIPLIIKFPHNRFSGMKVSQFIQQVDLAPSVLDSLSLKFSNEIQGKSFINIIFNKYCKDDRYVFTEVDIQGRKIRSITTPRWKFILNENRNFIVDIHNKYPMELYDMKNDVRETKNIFSKKPVLSKYFRQEILKIEKNLKKCCDKKEKAGKTEISDEIAAQLKALGYL